MFGVRVRSYAVVAFASALIGAPASAQIPPETSTYEIVDLVPPAAPVACGCVSGAFALPALQPGLGWGSGAGTPLRNAPASDASRERDAKRRAEEHAHIPRDAADGLGGNGTASFSVAMTLREASLAAGVDSATEGEVAKWLHLAATQEHPDALRLLGYRYQRGLGVAQSDEAAAFFFHRGALGGDKISMVALGLRYAAGRGAPQDFAAAVRWWRRADNTLASRFLGDAYACGLGVDQDAGRAVREYTKSADAGDLSSSIQLGKLYLGGCVPPNPSIAPATQDQVAFKAFSRAADQGLPDAQIALSELFLSGRGVELQPGQAYYWARIAEKRLEPGELKTRANALVAAAARLMTPAERDATEQLVDAMIITRPRQ